MENQPQIIKTCETDRSELDKLRKCRISASKTTGQYSRLLHYCSFDTLRSILNNNTFRNNTFRCTSLSNAKLNDQFEAKRKNVERFAGSRFIACFSHCQHEIVPFWYNYGGTDKQRKVVLKIKNFSDYITDVFYTDYCLLPSGMKMFFQCDEYDRTVNINGFLGQMQGKKPINTDFELKTCVERLSFFDVIYLPLSDNVFVKDYHSDANIVSSDGKDSFPIPLYDPRNLGKHKTEHWEYEQETRLMCITYVPDYKDSDYIYLRLKERFFEDLEIVMCPWEKDGFSDEIEDIINNSSLSEPIKKSIKIVQSELHGQVL